MIGQSTSARYWLTGRRPHSVTLEDHTLDTVHVVGRGGRSAISGGSGRFASLPILHYVIIAGQLIQTTQIAHLGRYFPHI